MSAKILVIDDHPDTVRLIEMTLRRFGHIVLGANSGQGGLELAAQELPDLILLDLMMPDMDGYEVCRRLRNHEKLAKIPIMMFTAKSQAEDKLRGFNLGVDDYLTKPTRPAELSSRVEAILQRAKTDEAPPPEPEPTPARPEKRLVAVLGARGGAGATTVAINLAYCLVGEQQPTCLVDFDTIQGHIGVYLNQMQRPGLVELLKLPSEDYAVALEQYLVTMDSGLQLLPTRPKFDSPLSALPPAKMKLILDLLLEPGRIVVADFGCLALEYVELILEKAAQILICLRPERPAMLGARQLIHYFTSQSIRPDIVHALMLDFGTGSLPKAAVESFLGIPLANIVSVYGQEIAQATNSGTPLVHLYPNSPMALSFHHLAHELAKKLITQ